MTIRHFNLKSTLALWSGLGQLRRYGKKMSHLETKLERVWFSSGHDDLWGCDSTYCRVPNPLLPDLGEISSDLQWLNEIPEITGGCTLDSDDNRISHLDEVLRRAEELSLELPPGFVTFLRSPNLQSKVPTCTCCFLELSDAPIPVPDHEGTFVLRFLNDSQSCVMWYLLFQPSRKPIVIASYYFFEREIFEALAHEEDDTKYEEAFSQAVVCADSFLEFLNRFWVENHIWYSHNDGRDLSATERAYEREITTKP